jgi:aminoglycoside 2'-N-acetyltransferase I
MQAVPSDVDGKDHAKAVLMHLEVVAADALGRAARAEIIALCEAAYGEDFARLFEELTGSVHVLLRDERGVLVSHAEWVTRWLQPAAHPILRTAYVEAVATAPERQGRGLATAVLRHVSDVLGTDSSWELAALSPSDPAFYAHLGWELWPGPLGIRRGDCIEPTPSDEQVMILRLVRTPATLVTTSLLTAEWRVGELW